MNKEEIIVSFIVPLYNVEMYLNECIDSILKVEGNTEIILIDDGSTDRSSDICDEYSRKYKKVKVIHQKNCGPAIARNNGIKIANGKYICFVDSDDFIDSIEFTKILQELEEYSYDIIYGSNFEMIFPKGTSKKIKEENIDTNSGIKLLSDIFQKKTKYSMSYIWINIYKREYIIKNNIYFCENIYYGEDTDWNIRLLKGSDNIKKGNMNYYKYRGNRKGSLATTKNEKAIVSYYELVEKWINNTIKDDIMLEIKRYYSYSFLDNLQYLWKYTNNNNELLLKIYNGKFWDYVDENNRIKKQKLKGIKVFKKKLHELYVIFELKIILKKVLIILKLIDR